MIFLSTQYCLHEKETKMKYMSLVKSIQRVYDIAFPRAIRCEPINMMGMIT